MIATTRERAGTVRTKHIRRRRSSRLFLSGIEVGLRTHFWIFVAFLYLPILVMVIYSFDDSRYVLVWQGFTTKWYGQAFRDATFREGLGVSLRVAALATTSATVLGTCLAVGLRDVPGWVRALIGAVMVMTLVTPEIITGLSALLFFSRVGVPLGMQTITAIHMVFGTSIIALLVGARQSGMDTTLEEASADLGASPVLTFFTVTLPLLSPAILAGALLAFTLSFDNFVISFFTSGSGSQTLPLRIWGQIRFGVSPAANALASMIIGFSLTMISLAFLLYRWRARTTGDGDDLLLQA